MSLSNILGEVIELLGNLVEVMRASQQELDAIKKKLQNDSSIDDAATEELDKKYGTEP